MNRLSNSVNRYTRKLKNLPRRIVSTVKRQPFHPTMASRKNEFKRLENAETKGIRNLELKLNQQRMYALEDSQEKFMRASEIANTLSKLLENVKGKSNSEQLIQLNPQKTFFEKSINEAKPLLIEVMEDTVSVQDEALKEAEKNYENKKKLKNIYKNHYTALAREAAELNNKAVTLHNGLNSLLEEFNQIVAKPFATPLAAPSNEELREANYERAQKSLQRFTRNYNRGKRVKKASGPPGFYSPPLLPYTKKSPTLPGSVVENWRGGKTRKNRNRKH